MASPSSPRASTESHHQVSSPLLPRSTSLSVPVPSDLDDDDDALRLGGSRTKGCWDSRLGVGLGLGLVAAMLAVGLLSAWFKETPRTNFILMVSDGFGPASETFARDFQKHLLNLSPSDLHSLPLDSILIGSSRTRSSDSLVTDSAAGATAFSCGEKSYNGAISVGAEAGDGPCGTVMEGAKAAGYLTGLVVTSRLTHATPACFYAHVVDRDMESEIAEFLVGDGPLGHLVDLALGGGRCFFLSNTTTSSCRVDSKDLLASPSLSSHTVLSSLSDYTSAVSPSNVLPLPVLGLFHRDHMSYNIDRKRLPKERAEPALSDMALTALRTLDGAAKAKGGKEGFFLMIEGSRIDMAAHSNDPANHAEEIFEYQRTVQAVQGWMEALPRRHRERTVMLSVSDHETGGLALARQMDPTVYPVYNWYPAALVNVTHSAIHLAYQIVTSLPSSSSSTPSSAKDNEAIAYLHSEIFLAGLGISDPTPQETAEVLEAREDVLTLDRLLADMTSRRAQVGWSSHGHSAVDVNLYMSPFDPDFHGSKENIEIGQYIARHLSLSLAKTTSLLHEDLASWFLPRSTSNKPKGGQQRRSSSSSSPPLGRGIDARGVNHFHEGCRH